MTEIATHPGTAGKEIAPAPLGDLAPARTRVSGSIADLERRVGHYPEKARVETVWAQGFFLHHCQNNVDRLRAIAEKLGFERKNSFFYNALNGYFIRQGTGERQGDMEYWQEIVAALRRYALHMARVGRMAFIETPTYRCFDRFITAKRALAAVCKFGGITGPTGSQKTACARYYAELNNHGTVGLFQAPAKPSVARLQCKITAVYSNQSSKLVDARCREAVIRENFNEARTLLIDNAQRLFNRRTGGVQDCFDYLLELQEDTGGTIILLFTEDFVDTLTAGVAKGYFEQFIGRMGGVQDILRLPKWTPEADLRCVARHFGLRDGPGAVEVLTRWSREPGRIRIVFGRLQRAQEIAKAERRDRITLDDLKAAQDFIPPAVGDDAEEGGAE